MSGTMRSRLPIAAATVIAVAVGAVLLVPTHPESGILRLLASILPAGTLNGGSGTWWAVEDLGNVALFVPVGAAAALLLTPGRALLVGVAFSIICEAAQLVIPSRNASFQDVIMNSLGAAFGVAVTALVRGAIRRRHASATSPQSVHAQ